MKRSLITLVLFSTTILFSAAASAGVVIKFGHSGYGYGNYYNPYYGYRNHYKPHYGYGNSYNYKPYNQYSGHKNNYYPKRKIYKHNTYPKYGKHQPSTSVYGYYPYSKYSKYKNHYKNPSFNGYRNRKSQTYNDGYRQGLQDGRHGNHSNRYSNHR